MTNKKIFRIAKTLLESEEINIQTPNDAYHWLKNSNNAAKEYYRLFGPDNLVKLCIALWAFNSDMNESEIENIYNNLFFATLLLPTNEDYLEQCDDCDGSGYVTCDNCSGNGQVDCEYCDGDGTSTCDACDGSGEIEIDEDETKSCDKCSGNGEITCDSCGGEGREECYYCGGGGSEECGNCSGDGEINSGKSIFYIDVICSWNQELGNLCEIREGTKEPLMSKPNYNRLKNNILLLTELEKNGNYEITMSSDDVYCVNKTDLMDLWLNTKLNFVYDDDEVYYEHLVVT